MTKDQKQSAKEAIVRIESRHNCYDLDYKIVNVRMSTKKQLVVADVFEYEDGKVCKIWRDCGYPIETLKTYGYRG